MRETRHVRIRDGSIFFLASCKLGDLGAFYLQAAAGVRSVGLGRRNRHVVRLHRGLSPVSHSCARTFLPSSTVTIFSMNSTPIVARSMPEKSPLVYRTSKLLFPQPESPTMSTVKP